MSDEDIDGLQLAVIILTVDQREKTLACLGSLARILPNNARILVWDNGSVDGTAEAIRLNYPDVVVQHHRRNLGVASGRNRGARLAIRLFEPTYLLFLDNDTIVTEGFVQELLKPFTADETGNVGQAQAKLRLMHEPDLLNDGGGCRVRFWLGTTIPVGYREIDRGQHDEIKPCVACGGAMMVRTDVFEQLDGFDPLFDPFGPEDLDFSLRLQKAGYRALYVPTAVAYHEDSHTTGEDGYTEHYAKLRSQHWLAFMRRHASVGEKLGFYLLGLPLIGLRVLVREGGKGNWRALRGLATGALHADRKHVDRNS
jgi:GT2 family glycosyltransferase